MQRYLIQVTHDPDPWACARVVETFLSTGSHYLTQADWGCSDGNHAAWMIVEAASREEARCIVPPALRAEAVVVMLNKFTLETLEEAMKEHRRKEDPDGPAG